MLFDTAHSSCAEGVYGARGERGRRYNAADVTGSQDKGAENVSEALQSVLSAPQLVRFSLVITPVGMIPATSGGMLFFLLAHAFSLLLDLIWLGRRAEPDKEIEILLLRQQLRILHRKHPHAPRISRWQKLTLVVLAGKLTTMTSSGRARLGKVVLLFKPSRS